MFSRNTFHDFCLIVTHGSVFDPQTCANFYGIRQQAFRSETISEIWSERILPILTHHGPKQGGIARVQPYGKHVYLPPLAEHFQISKKTVASDLPVVDNRPQFHSPISIHNCERAERPSGSPNRFQDDDERELSLSRSNPLGK